MSAKCKGETVDDMSFQQNPLLNHAHFRKIKDLNEGTFGFVQLATDTRTGQQAIFPFFFLMYRKFFLDGPMRQACVQSKGI